MTAELTEFGQAVWVLAAKRVIATQRELARRLTEASEAGERVHHDTVRYYLYGRSSVPTRFLHQLDKGLVLSHEDKHSLVQVYAWGETRSGAA